MSISAYPPPALDQSFSHSELKSEEEEEGGSLFAILEAFRVHQAAGPQLYGGYSLPAEEWRLLYVFQAPFLHYFYISHVKRR